MIITDHALDRCAERGGSLHEIKVVLQKGINVPAKEGRKAKEFVFDFNRNWRGRYYHQKKVRVIYVEEYSEEVVLTVYVYFGKWR